MKLGKKLLTACALTALLPTSASAAVLAQSVLQVTNFQFLDGSGTQLALTDFQALVFSDNTDATATLNGTTDSDSASTSVFTTLDLAQQCVGDCSFAENDYSPHAAPTTTVARGDTLLEGAPLITGDPVVDAFGGADAYTLAEAQLLTDGGGSSQSNLGLLATFQFVLNDDQTVTLEFDADIWLRAMLTADVTIPGSDAQASASWTIEVVESNTGALVFSWTPDGAAGGIIGGTENSDSCDLTRTVAAQLPGQTSTHDCDGFFSATTNTLIGGTLYTLNLRHTTEADANNLVVPEPDVLALLGIGLLGLGFSARRKLFAR